MKPYIIPRTVVRFLLPFIIMYAFYIQFHGEYSPGGGFQAGVILASGFIVYSLVNDLEAVKKIASPILMRILSAFGVLLYALVGVVSMLMGGEFLDYGMLASDPVKGEKIGIVLIELGVGITVFAVMMLFFYSFGERSGGDV